MIFIPLSSSTKCRKRRLLRPFVQSRHLTSNSSSAVTGTSRSRSRAITRALLATWRARDSSRASSCTRSRDDGRPGVRAAVPQPTAQRGGLLVVLLHPRDLVAAADRPAGVSLCLRLPLRGPQAGGSRGLAVAGPTRQTSPGHRSSGRRGDVLRAAGLLAGPLQDQRDLPPVFIYGVLAGGDRRRIDELWACTKVLGIPEANVTIIMSSELPDDQSVQWPTDTVAESILQYVEMYKINAVVTFDKYGVSRHKNHISLYFAIAALCIEKKVPPYCKLYVLESVNIIRKYIQLLDLPVSLLSASYWYLVTHEQKRTIKNAMAAHKSQYVWFRKLYMIFSRYTFINTLQEVSALDLELDLQFDED